jgi:hypothetical protein
MFGFKGLATVLGVAITPLFAWLVLATSHHGLSPLSVLLFPYTMALAPLSPYLWKPLLILALVQFPAYGLLIDWARSRGRARRYALKLAALHAALVVLGVVVYLAL